jgi:hypothetical protein
LCGGTGGLLVSCLNGGPGAASPPGEEYPGATGRRGELGLWNFAGIVGRPVNSGAFVPARPGRPTILGKPGTSPPPLGPVAEGHLPLKGRPDLREPHSSPETSKSAVPTVAASPSQAVRDPAPTAKAVLGPLGSRTHGRGLLRLPGYSIRLPLSRAKLTNRFALAVQWVWCASGVMAPGLPGASGVMGPGLPGLCRSSGRSYAFSIGGAKRPP